MSKPLVLLQYGLHEARSTQQLNKLVPNRLTLQTRSLVGYHQAQEITECTLEPKDTGL